MLDKLQDFYNLFRDGQSVADAVGLKNKQNLANAITVFLGTALAIGKLYGFNLPLDDSSLVSFGGAAAAIWGVFNVGATVASSDKIGLLPSRSGKDIGGTDFGITLPVPTVSETDSPTRNITHSSTDYPALAGLDSTYNG